MALFLFDGGSKTPGAHVFIYRNLDENLYSFPVDHKPSDQWTTHELAAKKPGFMIPADFGGRRFLIYHHSGLWRW